MCNPSFPVFPPEIYTTDGGHGVTSGITGSCCGSTAVFHNVTQWPVWEFPVFPSDPDIFVLNPKCIPMFCLQPYLRAHQLTHNQVASSPDTFQAFAL